MPGGRRREEVHDTSDVVRGAWPAGGRLVDQQLTALAKSKGLTVPTKLDAQHEAMVKALSAKSGAAFDSAYADHMAKGHTKAVALFESASQSSDADLAAFAKQTLPTLQQHEQLANNLRASVKTRTASAQ